MAEERYHIQRKQSQIELQRRKSMKELKKGNSMTEMDTPPMEVNGDTTKRDDGDEIVKLKGFALFKSRLFGLIMKRIICTWRRWVLFLLIVSP